MLPGQRQVLQHGGFLCPDIFFARSVVKDGKEEERTSSLKLKRSLWVKKRESGIFSVGTKFQKPISFIKIIFFPVHFRKGKTFSPDKPMTFGQGKHQGFFTAYF